jgi:hypothetical protein
MASVNETFRAPNGSVAPERLVLLCTEPGCKGAATALGRSGYNPRLQSATQLEWTAFGSG